MILMKFLQVTPANIRKAAKVIRDGGLVAFPTETVYGLGADALNPIACAKIFEAKKRPFFDPIIVHVSSVEQARTLFQAIPEQAEILISQFWPGPLTLVIPKTAIVPDIVTAGLDTVAVRMPSHHVAAALVQAAGTPIAAPSANLFQQLSPTTAEHVREQLGDSVDIILDGGPATIGVESTILKVGEPPVLLRPGGLPLEAIEEVIGPVKVAPSSTENPEAPGQMKTHYAPRTPLMILRDPAQWPADARVGYLAFATPAAEINVDALEILSPTGDLREAAANLFACLHRLDAAGTDIILAEPVPEEGLGRAIMNRLQKAASD
jgi:L-threonylcarbamoyladenylate synthase